MAPQEPDSVLFVLFILFSVVLKNNLFWGCGSQDSVDLLVAIPCDQKPIEK